MKFLDYIRGQRKGEDAHRIERNSMQDPFLYEAIEGFDSIDDNHIERINNIQNRLRAKSETTKHHRHIWQTVAAAVVIIVGISGYFLVNTHESGLYAQESNKSLIIDVYVPETYYVDNIVPISQRNAEVAREVYKPNISKFKATENTNHNLSKKELEMLSGKGQSEQGETVIEIYIPENLNRRSN